MAFWIAFTAIHITRERFNGSKSLQLMSKTRTITFWISNYLFDGLVHLINLIILIILVIFCYIVLDNKGTEFSRVISSSQSIVYLTLVILSIIASGLTFAYYSSSFFKSDILAFAILFVVMMSFVLIDMVLAIASTLVKIAFANKLGDENKTDVAEGSLHFNRLDWVRTFIAIIFPNVNAKRAVYNLKLQSWNVCSQVLSENFNCKPKIYFFLPKNFIIILLF